MLRCAIFALLVLGATLHTASAEDLDTDANIITGLDVSSSINAQETVLQIDGMAQAIRAPEVLAAIQRGAHGRIGFSVFVWADGDYPELISWRMIGSEQDAAAASQEIKSRLEAILKSASHNVGSLTDLSAAMEHAAVTAERFSVQLETKHREHYRQWRGQRGRGSVAGAWRVDRARRDD